MPKETIREGMEKTNTKPPPRNPRPQNPPPPQYPKSGTQQSQDKSMPTVGSKKS